MRRLVVPLAAALLTVACPKKQEAPAGGGPAPAASASAEVNTLKVDQALIASGRVVVGKVERRVPRGERRVPGEVRTSEKGRAEAGALVSGRVSSIEVALGDHVSKGAVLAWIDAPELGRAVADVLRARARVSAAGNKLQRQLELEKQNATSKNALDEARAESLVAQADLAAARTYLFTLGGSEPASGAVGARLAVRAPIEGTVSKRDAVLGAPVSPEKSLFEIVAPSDLHVVARVPETVPLPPVGTLARLFGRGRPDDAGCEARSVSDVGVVDEATRTRALRFAPTAPCAMLVPGGFVDVALPTTEGAAKAEIVVPRESVVEVHGAKVVFVAKEGGYVARPVRVGGITGLDAIVEDGLREGEVVVVRGAILLKGELLRSELEGE
ncbi:MAG: efflux RND transporter periplasmic adaptor subunit [Deltaproteobacteria bacterium]|nr:efflux RND transporter periplasmic adaptor subunit [Deltaproteobacteria bacterium]